MSVMVLPSLLSRPTTLLVSAWAQDIEARGVLRGIGRLILILVVGLIVLGVIIGVLVARAFNRRR